MTSSPHRLAGLAQKRARRQAEVQAVVQYHYIQRLRCKGPVRLLGRNAFALTAHIQQPAMAQHPHLRRQQLWRQPVLHQMLAKARRQHLTLHLSLGVQQHAASRRRQPLARLLHQAHQISLTD